MDVFTHSAVIAGNGDEGEGEGDIPSLVDGVRAGRPAAVERLAARVRAQVHAWAARFTDDSDSADDVTQVVLIGLERRVRRFDGHSRFSTWLFAVTRNVALSQRRRDERRSALLKRQGELAAEHVHELSDDPDAARLAALVLRYFDALPRRQRQVFELSDVRGWSPAEIARELGMQQVTVRAHLFRARKAIREQMLEHHERLLKEYTS